MLIFKLTYGKTVLFIPSFAVGTNRSGCQSFKCLVKVDVLPFRFRSNSIFSINIFLKMKTVISHKFFHRMLRY